MKQPQTDTTEADKAGELLARLEQTTAASLKDGVAKVEGISKNDEENHGRWLKSKRKQITLKLTSWFLHFLFVIVCLMVLFVVVGTLWLTTVWIISFADKPTEVSEFLSRMWEIGLVALATLFVQSIIPKE